VLREFYGPFEKRLAYAQEHMPAVRKEEPVGRDCPECGSPLIVRWGRYGKFIGCSAYPKCRYTEPWLEKIGVKCPKCGGDIAERKTRRGRVFYGCVNYPECDFTSWKRPLPQRCPVCGGLLVAQNKQSAVCTDCGEQMRLEDLPQPAEAVQEEA
jgi:DNA topoisomerase-1